MFAADGNKQEPLREEMRCFLETLFPFLKIVAAKLLWERFSVTVSASGGVTPDGGKRCAGVSGGGDGFFCRDAHGSKTSNFVSLNPVSDVLNL